MSYMYYKQMSFADFVASDIAPLDCDILFGFLKLSLCSKLKLFFLTEKQNK